MRIRESGFDAGVGAGEDEAHADHAGAVVCGVPDAVGDRRGGPAAVCAEDLHRHHAARPADTGAAEAVVRPRGDDAGDHRPVAVLVGGVAGSVREVGAGNERALQVRLRRIDAAVDHGDHDRSGAG